MMGPLTGHHDDLVHIAPDPVLPRLEGLYERVPGGVEVLGRVFVLGVVATSYVSADQALPKMDPGVAHLQALLAAVRARLYVLDLVQVRTVRRHLLPPSLLCGCRGTAGLSGLRTRLRLFRPYDRSFTLDQD